MSEKSSSSGGIGFFGLLGILFVAHIDWSWWVTAPLWGGLVLIFAVLLVAVLVAALAGKR